MANRVKPCRPIQSPNSFLLGMKAAIKMMYTGSRAEQLISGATIMVVKRSRLSSIVRVAIIPGIAQAKLESRGMKDLPERPQLVRKRSISKAALAI